MIPRHVLVTGACGFVGSHIVDALDAIDCSVRTVDLNASDEPADLADLDIARKSVRGIDTVCHQAAKVGLGVDFGDAPAYVQHNVAATAALLAALHEQQFAGRIVLASSMVVYGEGAYRCRVHGPVRPGPREAGALAAGRFEPPCPACGEPLEPATVDEDAPTDPRNVYALTKLAQEHLCFTYGREHPGTTVTALRYHNVYGPRMPRDTPYAGVAALFRSAMERGETPRVFEDGGQRRDFVHVHDVARANVLAMTIDEPFHGPLNIASGTPHTILDLATALSDASGPEALRPVVTGEWRLGDVRHVVASPDRARKALGFDAEVGFIEGMRQFATAPLRPA
ncbi:MAG: NAD-dependent epimerase/dehydratase family protein [Actinomycetota bacterium]|nr:NAD-dependent epimerase/dehydratase family protein [Actinomycetota bacterium]